MKRLFFLSGILLLIVSCNNNPSGSTNNEPAVLADPPAMQYSVVNVYPHDTASFTQGLVIHNGKMYESTGGSHEYPPNKSWVGIVDMNSGKILQKAPLDPAFFGEGITILNEKIYQLTWQSHKGFVYDAKTLARLQEFPLKTEGWGITNDSTHLIISDGSSNLYFIDPTTFATAKVLGVTDNNGPVSDLNELEYINGVIYANKWESNYIYKIDPSNGKVLGRADLTNLVSQYMKDLRNDRMDAVLNGIAYDAATGKTYITGKLWPKLFEVKFQ